MFLTVRSFIGRLPRFWQLQLAGWTACAAAGFVLRLILFEHLKSAVLLTLFQEPLGFGTSCLLREAYRRLNLSQGFTWRATLWVFFLSIGSAVIDTALIKVFIQVMGLRSQNWSPTEEWIIRIAVFWLLFIVWSFLYLWLKAELQAQSGRRRAAEAQMMTTRMELQLLRARLDPHFLFNTLNGIAAEIPVHSQNALAMVRELADYLRFSLDHRENGVVPLISELDAMGHYLRIEQARFGGQFTVQIQAEEKVRYRPIPVFLLQHLVENAVKYGRQTSDPPWKVTIEASATDYGLCLKVWNAGTLTVPPYAGSGSGIGLSLLRRRLELLFPDRHRFTLREDQGSVCAELELQGEPCCV
jgi:two-component system LytT family sensor kinase